MQTNYYNTQNCIRHNGNIIDFSEYRNRINNSKKSFKQKKSDSEFWTECFEEEFDQANELAFEEDCARSIDHRSKKISLRMLPDLCASFAIVAMAVAVISYCF